MADPLMTPEEVAAELRYSRRTVLDWMRAGRLLGVKIGRQWRMIRGDLDTAKRGER